ncbi:MAG: DNA polymerase I [Clostridia bacterium]|nr:DNA polymerase I [Clostridia bacterium]
MKKLLCIDGNSILNRQFYGIRPLSNKEGFPTNAIFGFVNVIAKQLEALSPDYTAVAFDLKAPTFRHTMYGEYKAGRKPMPEDLALQLPVAKDLCRAMGFAVLSLEGYEADDILGTLSSWAENAEEETEAYVLTGDRDSLQLISDKVKVLLATNSDTVMMDDAAFFEKYGVHANQYVDVKALMGDSSDNIPGVPGVGEKTAFKLIAEQGDLDSIYENLDGIKLTNSVRAKMESGRESAYLSKTLATISRDVPLGLTLNDISNKGIDRVAARELFLRYELLGALKRFGLDREEAEGEQATAERPRTETLPAKALSSLDGDTYAVSLSEGGIYISDGKRVFAAEIGPEAEQLLRTKRIIACDCKALYQALEKQGVHWRDCYFDVMLGAYVDDSAQSAYTVERLVTTYLSEAADPEIPSAYYVARMWSVIEERLEQSGQNKLLYDVEMPLAAVLCDMELAGFRIDRDGIAAYGVELDEEARALESRIYMAAGEEFNINSPKQLGEVLFEKLMLPAGKKTKTGYSTGAEILEKLSKYHPIIDDILEYRQVTKLKSTYVDGLLKSAGSDGRCHTTFKQTGTATGRLSSQNPNLQNIPIRTEAGRRFRKYFVAKDEAHVLIDADYSQIELRVLAHVSGDENMIDAFLSGDDIHTATSCRVFGVAPEEVTVEMRKRAKAINFGILYGMGEFSLADDLKISRAKAKEYIESYLSGYPAIESYLEAVAAEAREQGYVTTMLGRRRYIPELAAKNKNLQAFGERVARNSPIQGSSADIIKLAMINIDKKLREGGTGARLLLQVHDELLIESPRECAEEVLELLKTEMENAVKLLVPLKVEAAIGDNWLECH